MPSHRSEHHVARLPIDVVREVKQRIVRGAAQTLTQSSIHSAHSHQYMMDQAWYLTFPLRCHKIQRICTHCTLGLIALSD